MKVERCSCGAPILREGRMRYCVRTGVSFVYWQTDLRHSRPAVSVGHNHLPRERVFSVRRRYRKLKNSATDNE